MNGRIAELYRTMDDAEQEQVRRDLYPAVAEAIAHRRVLDDNRTAKDPAVAIALANVIAHRERRAARAPREIPDSRMPPVTIPTTARAIGPSNPASSQHQKQPAERESAPADAATNVARLRLQKAENDVLVLLNARAEMNATIDALTRANDELQRECARDKERIRELEDALDRLNTAIRELQRINERKLDAYLGVRRSVSDEPRRNPWAVS